MANILPVCARCWKLNGCRAWYTSRRINHLGTIPLATEDRSNVDIVGNPHSNSNDTIGRQLEAGISSRRAHQGITGAEEWIWKLGVDNY